MNQQYVEKSSFGELSQIQSDANQIIFYSCQIQELFCNPGCLRPFSSPFWLCKPWIFTSPKLWKNAQRLACQVYPVQGLDGIRTLNPGLESVSQLEFLEISALRIFFCFFGWLVTYFFCLVKSFSWRPVGKTPSQRQAEIGLMGSWECKGTPPKIGTMVVINNFPIRAPFFPMMTWFCNAFFSHWIWMWWNESAFREADFAKSSFWCCGWCVCLFSIHQNALGGKSRKQVLDFSG